MDERFMSGLSQMIIDGVVEGTVEGITEELNKVTKGSANTNNGKRFLNKKEVCNYLGISYPTLKIWSDNGLKYSLIEGKSYLYDVEDIIEFVKENEIKDT